jgi:hypothetical protein
MPYFVFDDKQKTYAGSGLGQTNVQTEASRAIDVFALVLSDVSKGVLLWHSVQLVEVH